MNFRGYPKKSSHLLQKRSQHFFTAQWWINKTPLKNRREASGQMLAIEIPGEFSTDKVWVQCCVVLASSLVAWSQVARSTATFFQVELHPVVQATHQFSAIQILRKWARQLGENRCVQIVSNQARKKKTSSAPHPDTWEFWHSFWHIIWKYTQHEYSDLTSSWHSFWHTL